MTHLLDFTSLFPSSVTDDPKAFEFMDPEDRAFYLMDLLTPKVTDTQNQRLARKIMANSYYGAYGSRREEDEPVPPLEACDQKNEHDIAAKVQATMTKPD